MKSIVILFLFSLMSVTVWCQKVALKTDNWELINNPGSTIHTLKFLDSQTEIPFFEEGQVGPVFYYKTGDKIIDLPLSEQSATLRRGIYDDLSYSVEYKVENDRLMWLLKIKNGQNVPIQPTTIGIKTGLNPYMDHYPDWEDKFFPTLLRCEKTHFWGYLMSPLGKILVIASPDPVASWSHEYSKVGSPLYQDEGHRITSINIDLINALPLPERHPQNLWQLLPGEEKVFRLYFEEVESLRDVNKVVSEITKTPVIEMERTSIEKGGEFGFSIISHSDFKVQIIKPNGKIQQAEDRNSTQQNEFLFSDTSQEGLYQIHVSSENGKNTEGTFYVRKPYSWYMDKAMQAVIDYPQKASKTHCESWYGFYTIYSGAMYLPDHLSIGQADKQFYEIFNAILDTETLEPLQSKHRIQNVSTLIGILVDRYAIFNEELDILKAIKLAGQLMKAQSPDGAYRAGKTHYTSVAYPAKSMIELMEILETSGLNIKYKNEYDKINASVKRAIDELECNRTNVQTEGELTFEDGMISCSSLQLAAFALRQKDENQRKKYRDAAIDILTQHECLQQLVVPDARLRSGTLRFWEAQYDVLMGNNFFNSPHGWSSWATYANYYAYLLTGEVKYLIRTFNGIDAAMQMINAESGNLKWAFMVNPYVKVKQIAYNIPGTTPMNFPGIHYHADRYVHKEYIAGETYIDMVSDWFMPNANDNDVHEHFKCLSEVALNKAYVVQLNESHEVLGFNCSTEFRDGVLHIVPTESIIDRVHVNILDDIEVNVSFLNDVKSLKLKKGMTWIEK